MNYYMIYEKLLISLYFLCHLFFCKIRNGGGAGGKAS